jgi:hypothetical protein
MRVSSVGWKPRALGDGLEHTEELGAMNFSALLRGENEITRIAAFGQPRLQDSPFRQERLPWMIAQRLYGSQATL